VGVLFDAAFLESIEFLTSLSVEWRAIIAREAIPDAEQFGGSEDVRVGDFIKQTLKFGIRQLTRKVSRDRYTKTV
jgi:hypothetical protein